MIHLADKSRIVSKSNKELASLSLHFQCLAVRVHAHDLYFTMRA